MKLASLCAGISNAIVRGQLLLTDGLTVQSILDENADAIADGGTMGEASTKVQGLFASGYHIVFGSGILICLIGIVVFGVSMAMSSSQGMAEKKSLIGWKAVGIVLVCCAVPIMLFAESIANGVFGG